MADDGDQLNMGLAALNQEAGRRLTWDEQEVLGDPTWQRDTAGLRRPMGLGVHVYEVCPWEQAPSSHWAQVRQHSVPSDRSWQEQAVCPSVKEPELPTGVQRQSQYKGSSRSQVHSLCSQADVGSHLGNDLSVQGPA